MAGILSGLFDFRSKEEKARYYEAYSKRIFPYGDAQKDAISDILVALFPDENKRYLIMYYILIKQGMTEEEAVDFKTAAAKTKKYRLLLFTPELQAAIQVILNADFAINEDLRYPSIEELRSEITNILSSDSTL